MGDGGEWSSRHTAAVDCMAMPVHAWSCRWGHSPIPYGGRPMPRVDLFVPSVSPRLIALYCGAGIVRPEPKDYEPWAQSHHGLAASRGLGLGRVPPQRVVPHARGEAIRSGVLSGRWTGISISRDGDPGVPVGSRRRSSAWGGPRWRSLAHRLNATCCAAIETDERGQRHAGCHERDEEKVRNA